MHQHVDDVASAGDEVPARCFQIVDGQRGRVREPGVDVRVLVAAPGTERATDQQRTPAVRRRHRPSKAIERLSMSWELTHEPGNPRVRLHPDSVAFQPTEPPGPANGSGGSRQILGSAMGRRDAVRMLVIDAANVIGSRPTGWWRDRPGAARRFTERVRETVNAGWLDPPVSLVLEGRARAGADEAVLDGVEVVHAPGDGDDTIVAIAEAHLDVIVVTADRELAERVRAANAEVVGPNWLLDQLVE